ncbi:tripartite tricarboxylate transporter TctB family protein [Roseomonas sp. AR75]|uniref:tripartite tricarboxylate transporter TctB family protein n=1 Tax=Roseomonas sp. AR75 TaxID=2562311 RepID=UPI0010C10D49|nr:hypothetical protein [Roseomonas sp. AR75]
MSQGETRRQPAWAELAFVTALAAGVLAFLVEARGVSLDPQNLLLLQPTAWLVLGLWAVLAIGCLTRRRPADAPPRESTADLLRILAMVAAFGLFTAGLEQVGYDIAICAFVLVALLIGGERHWAALLLFPPLFTLAVIEGFRLLIPYPFPTTLL